MIRQAQVDAQLPVSRLLRTIISVSEVTPIQELLQQMIKRQTPIVVVLDEYGGTSGIVTDKDIYEELFGTVKDEIDDVSAEDIIKTMTELTVCPGRQRCTILNGSLSSGVRTSWNLKV